MPTSSAPDAAAVPTPADAADRLARIARLARIGFWDLDFRTGRVTWSPEMYAVHGVAPGTAIDVDLALSFYAPRERTRVARAVRAAVASGTPFEGDYLIRSADGLSRWLHLSAEVVTGADGSQQRLLGIAADVTEKHEDRQRLWQAASTDGMTGLPNRERFRTLLSDAIQAAQGKGTDVGLLMVDVDRLKEANDTFGHVVGDRLLAAVAERLADCCGPKVHPCRLGGDEFGVIVERCRAPADLDRLAERLIAAIGRPLVIDGHALAPSASIGGALSVGGATDKPSLRRNADLALYHAKETGRGRYARHNADLKTTILRRSEEVRLLSTCLEEGRTFPWYQPVISLDTGRLEGFEALTRLRTADGAVRSVGEFPFALADARTGHRLTSVLIEAVARDMAAWKAAGCDVRLVGLNVTSHDFEAGDLADRLAAAFRPAGIDLNRVVVEVTETVFLGADAEGVAATLARLRSLGIIVSLDDFGTGYASLTHLTTFPVDTIKIDRSFVARMLDDDASAAIVETLIDLGARLDTEVVAEGVETAEQMERLRFLGCPYAQGYLFSRPLPARDVPAFFSGFAGLPRSPVARFHRLAGAG